MSYVPGIGYLRKVKNSDFGNSYDLNLDPISLLGGVDYKTAAKLYRKSTDPEPMKGGYHPLEHVHPVEYLNSYRNPSYAGKNTIDRVLEKEGPRGNRVNVIPIGNES
jgi:hypothetical protein